MVMRVQINLKEWNEKSMKENDYEDADGMKQEVALKDRCNSHSLYLMVIWLHSE